MNLSLTLAILVLVALGCASNPPTLIRDNELETEHVLLMCEDAIFGTAGQHPEKRADFQNCYDVLDVMLYDEMNRKDLCYALGLIGLHDFIPPEGGLIRLTADDLFINDRSISDEMVYRVAMAFWVGLNKALNPVGP